MLGIVGDSELSTAPGAFWEFTDGLSGELLTVGLYVGLLTGDQNRTPKAFGSRAIHSFNTQRLAYRKGLDILFPRATEAHPFYYYSNL